MNDNGLNDVLANLDKWIDERQALAKLAMEEVMAALANWAKTEHGHLGAHVTRGPAADGSGPQRRVKNGAARNEEHEPPFWDETGATTNSIKGEVVEASATIVRGVLSAGMEYDVYLELAHDGKWAFLWPTIVNHEKDIMDILRNRLGASVGTSLSRSGSLKDDYLNFRLGQARDNALGAD